MLYDYDNIFNFSEQLEFYEYKLDKRTGQKVNHWEDKKKRNLLLADSYKRIGKFKKAVNVRQCGTFLEFKEYIATGDFRLHRANFCKVRLCPLCSWRRSLKIFGQLSKVMDEVPKTHQFIFLTLTVRNCVGQNLNQTMDDMFKAFNLFMKYKVIKQTFCGWFRAFEITYNKKTATYHPHFHVVLCADKKYFKQNYISQEEFVELWKKALKIDYTPVVDVRKFRNSRKGVAESAKYTVKDIDYMTKKGVVIDHIVDLLDDVLKGRRLVAMGGLFKEIAKQLKLDDAVDGNLINTDGNEELRQDVDYIIHKFGWHVGFKSYYGLK